MNATVKDPIEMLVVEDNPADVVFLREVLTTIPASVSFQAVGDGEEALLFLRRQAPFAQAPRPDVVVLDLNLPVKSGQEVLVEMASDPALNTIPVAILTTSTFESCVCDLYPKGRCLYFSKAATLTESQAIVRQILEHAGKTWTNHQ